MWGLSWGFLVEALECLPWARPALFRRPAIGDRTHSDFDPRLIFVHGAGRSIDPQADNADEQHIAVMISVSDASTPTPVV